MAIIYQGIILLLVFSLASAQTSPPNPECRGMNTAARHLETGIKSITGFQRSAKCNPTKQCSGVICRWSSRSNGVLEVDLQYCRHPVNYHVHFKDSNLNVDRNFTIEENHRQTLYRNSLVTVSIKVTELRRSRNTVTTSVDVLTCPVFTPDKCVHTHVLPQQTFCVRMDKCQGFNASVDHYKPCTHTSPQTTLMISPSSTSHWSVPTTEPPFSSRSSSAGHWSVPTTEPPFSSRSSSAGHWSVPTTEPPFSSRSSSAEPHPHFPGKGPSSGHWSVPTTEPPFSSRSSSAGHWSVPTTEPPFSSRSSSAGHWSVPTTEPPFSSRSSSADKSSKDLSTGAIIGICVAGLFVILIVVGAAVYWKKYHRRTRLRAAYYNDISMHDPLCGEDFGPEVA